MNQTLHRVLCRITDLRRTPADQLKPDDILDCLEQAVIRMGEEHQDGPRNGSIPETMENILRIL